MSSSDTDEKFKLKEKGNEYFRKGDFNNAIQCFQNAITLDPEYIDAWNNLGFTYLKQGKTKEAKVCNDRVKQLKNLQQKKLEKNNETEKTIKAAIQVPEIKIQPPIPETQLSKPSQSKSVEQTQIQSPGIRSQKTVTEPSIPDTIHTEPVEKIPQISPESLQIKLPDLFLKNAYHVLGLDTSSDQKAIQKRAKELLNRLKIEDIPDYELDIELPQGFRTEFNVKASQQNLMSPKNCIQEFVFWFDLSVVNKQQEFYELLNNKKILNAIRLLANSESNNPNTDVVNKKNVAILFTVLLYNGSNKPYLKRSISYWQEIINSEQFWIFVLHEIHSKLGFEITNTSISPFKDQVVSHLGDIFHDISQKHNDNDYILEFGKSFPLKSESFTKDILEPVFYRINNSIDRLQALEIAPIPINKETNIANPLDTKKKEETFQVIKSLLEKIDADFNELLRYGLGNDSRVKILQDKIVKTIREMSLKICNHWENSSQALQYIQYAKSVAGNSNLTVIIEKDIEELTNLVNIDPILNSINASIQKEDYESALKIIQDYEKIKDNSKLLELLSVRKKGCVYGLAIKTYNNGMDLFKSERYSDSQHYFDRSASVIYENLDLFYLNKNTIDQILRDGQNLINQFIYSGNPVNLNQFRDVVIKTAKEHFEGQYEEHMLVCLVDSTVYSKLIQAGIYRDNPSLQKKTSSNVISQPILSAPSLITVWGIGTKLYGDTQYFVVLFIPVVPIARFSFDRIDNESYRFYEKLELRSWQKIWQYLFVLIVGFFIIQWWIILVMILWFVVIKFQNKSIF